jgi:hypothetical protein
VVPLINEDNVVPYVKPELDDNVIEVVCLETTNELLVATALL